MALTRTSVKRVVLLACVWAGVSSLLYLVTWRKTPPNGLNHPPFPKITRAPFPDNVLTRKFLCDDLNILKVRDVSPETETQDDVVVSYLQQNGVLAKKDLGRRRDTLDPEFEAPLFRYPPLRHAACLPDHRHSKVVLLTPREQIGVGSRVRFRIDIYTSCGEPRFLGGDVIRAWLRQHNPYGASSSVAAEVKDLHNGSYVGETSLPWSGVTSVRVSLTYAREFVQACAGLSRAFHAMRWVAERLEDGNGLWEDVACLPSTPIPGYVDTCDFTAANGGLPWYCGYPVTKGLNCTHRSSFRALPFIGPVPSSTLLQPYLDNLTRCCPDLEHMDLRLIPNDIQLHSPPAKLTPDGAAVREVHSPLHPCHRLSRRQTWRGPGPQGWFRYGQWLSALCPLPLLTTHMAQRCLRNKTLLFWGDWNQRHLWDHVQALAGCTYHHLPQNWNELHVCRNHSTRSTVLFAAHTFPFLTETRSTLPSSNNLPLRLTLNRARQLGYKDTKDIFIIIHFQRNLAPYSVQVYRSFVQATFTVVQEYLKLHPEVTFVIRGPHVTYSEQRHAVHAGDKHGEWYAKIWRDVFRGLEDKVWYLDTWDMTVAAENWDMGSPGVTSDIARALFGFVCDGDSL